MKIKDVKKKHGGEEIVTENSIFSGFKGSSLQETATNEHILQPVSLKTMLGEEEPKNIKTSPQKKEQQNENSSRAQRSTKTLSSYTDKVECPMCKRKVYVDEIEKHVNLCLDGGMKKEPQARKKKPPTPPPSLSQTLPTQINPLLLPLPPLPTAPPKGFTVPQNMNFPILPQLLTKQEIMVESGNLSVPPNKPPFTTSTTGPSKKRKSMTEPIFAMKLVNAPVFRPTKEEFAEPLKYIAKIRPYAEKFGICRILPPSAPEEWLHSQTIDNTMKYSEFNFRSKLQEVNKLQKRTSSSISSSFSKRLSQFWQKKGKKFDELEINGEKIDALALMTAVSEGSGYQMVTKHQKWPQIAAFFNIPTQADNVEKVKNFYETFLLPYDRKIKALEEEKDLDEEDSYLHCLSEEDEGEEFGFIYDTASVNLLDFKNAADEFKNSWFQKRNASNLKISEIENEFWSIIEKGGPVCKVHYGSDLSVSDHASGFPLERKCELSKCGCQWNLNSLPLLQDCILSHMKTSIKGVNIPMLYIGMVFSCFCWHNEDNYLYSINYLHDGAPKVWYGVPGAAALRFEAEMKKALPKLFESHPDLLQQLITMASPIYLMEKGVPICRTVQEPGQFVITFPQSYHAGLNTGFNIAEAVNFALEDWFPFGRESVQRYRSFNFRRPSVLPFHEILLETAKNVSPPSEWLVKEFITAIEEERDMRHFLTTTRGLETILDSRKPAKDCDQCKICRVDCYFSAVTCTCSPTVFACLHHAESFCLCKEKKYIVVYHTLSELNQLLEKCKSSFVCAALNC